ncbi:MAG TPA: arylsulfatase [Candidatus Sulfopaludibacter sp.]|nr:arylsulfatase [Candidatus Sulfopaludibacter sp.]
MKTKPKLSTWEYFEDFSRPARLLHTLGLLGSVALATSATPGCALAQTANEGGQIKEPNIMVIISDDVGVWNVGAYNRGMMGGRTPNIDSIASQGALFTDYYAQQSCTAGRSAFITGQCPFRTGLLKVGLPGANQGLQDKDPTIAQLLKPYGYATAQIGKNHLGDLNKFLPTVHGFDEFFGILYHANAYDEPYEPDYPKNPAFFARFGPRDVLFCKASDVDDPTVEPRWGRVGKQTITDEGPLPPGPGMDPKAKYNMENFDEKLVSLSKDFMQRSVKADKPFFLWYCPNRMHVWTHLSPKWRNQSGYGLFADGMMELDWEVGQLLQELDKLGVASNTIVIFTADNGAETFSWPDGGNTPFRGEKGTTDEGGFRVPMLVKWPGVIKPGTIINDMMANEDWLPTFLDAAGDPNVKQELLTGLTVGDQTFKVYLDGYDFLPFFKGDTTNGPRHEFFYFTDNGDLNAMRYNDWKISFAQIEGNLFTGHRVSQNVPIVVNLREDPFERFPYESEMYTRWWADKLWTLVPAQAIVGQFLQTFIAFPPSQPNGSTDIKQFLDKIQSAAAGDGQMP